MSASPTALRSPYDVISDLATIDSSQNDNGYLTTARRCNPQAGQHGNLFMAAANVTGGNAAKVIVGHGKPGVIVTGTGEMQEQDPDTYLANDNQQEWDAPFGKILQSGSCSSLYLYSCETGAGEAGSEFLYQLAQLLNCAAFGSTGFIYIDGTGHFTLEPGACWQVATATGKPAPIPPVSNPATPVALSLETGQPSDSKLLKLADATDISFVPSMQISKPAKAITVQGGQAIRVLGNLKIREAMSLPGVPGALVTGIFTINFRDGSAKRYALLNDRMLRDLDSPKRYHYCSPNIRAQLISFI